MRGKSVTAAAFLLLAFGSAAQTITDFHVQLLAPLTTKWNRKGDMVSAKVVEPVSYRGAILEGEIREIQSALSPKKPASVQFQFHTLHVSGTSVPVSAALVSVANSRRQPTLDEDGNAIDAKNGSTAIGRLPPRPSPSALIRLSTVGSQLALASGSEMVVRLDQKTGR